MAPAHFPNDFLWGTATAAYQIEGAVDEDGRAPSIWDTFSHTPGNVLDGDTGDVACDHYHRWQDDVRLMQQLSMQAYRFSIAWPRVIPQGSGQVNQQGLDFYDRLVDGLLAANIRPFVTLYHWDLPQVLQDRGGWPNRDIVAAFAEYTDVVARRLGDRVKHWITHNEPFCSGFLGYLLGVHAPGLRDRRLALQAVHHLLLSHGQAVHTLRAAVPDAQIGITLNLSPAHAATDSPDDQAAAQRFDGFMNRWFLDPVYGRGYPQDMVELYGDLVPQMEPADLEVMAAPTDFLGVNYYNPATVRAVSTDVNPLGFAPRSTDEIVAAGREVTAMGWGIAPEGLSELLLRLHRDYSPPAIYITENGAAFDDQLVDGQVHDPRRITYLRDHFRAAHAAMSAGVPLRGYFVWSLMDNFEWAYGYTKRFGIVYVDYATQERIPKASAHWYQGVIAANAVPEQ